MDIAFPVGPKRRDPDQLAWSVRSFMQHYPVDRIFLAGQRLPEWVDQSWERLVFLPTSQSRSKFWNIGENLDAVLASDISDEFLWCNDDFFILQDIPERLPVYSRTQAFDLYVHKLYQMIANRPAKGEFREYVDGLDGQVKVLASWGIKTRDKINVDTHTPLRINKAECAEVIARVKAEFPRHPYGMFRSIYGATRDPMPIEDPKIMRVNVLPKPGWWMVSTNDRTWLHGEVGKWLRERFKKPSPLEQSGARV